MAKPARLFFGPDASGAASRNTHALHLADGLNRMKTCSTFFRRAGDEDRADQRAGCSSLSRRTSLAGCGSTPAWRVRRKDAAKLHQRCL